MNFRDGTGELTEVSETKRIEDQGFSREADDKFDKLMGDDKIEDATGYENIEKPKLTPIEREIKFDKLFGFDDIDEKNEVAALPNSEKADNAVDEQDHEAEEESESSVEKDGLTDDERARIKEEKGWSDEIINAIGSMKEYEIYKEAGLVEAEINGKKCLIRNDIDWDQKDAMGRTNRERSEQGLSPINKDGKVVELHHIGQHADSPLAELTPEEHRGKGNDTILHDKKKESEIDRFVFAEERSEHWKSRAEEGGM